MIALRCRVLSTEAPDDPPSEFRIFKRGRNATSKGVFLFDDAAARSVMARYAEEGRDLMVDLEHDSLAKNAVRDDMCDARGWFSLELRGGELWAVNVRWTPDGERRLREKTQRYLSPAFEDDDDGRVTWLVNVALTSMPATHDAVPLVAAALRTVDHRRARVKASSFNEVMQAVTAALRDKHPYNEADPSSSVYVCDVYDAYAVYEFDGAYYSVGYSYNNGAARITSEPVQVVRKYVPAKQVTASQRAKAFYLTEIMNRGPRKDQSRTRRN